MTEIRHLFLDSDIILIISIMFMLMFKFHYSLEEFSPFLFDVWISHCSLHFMSCHFTGRYVASLHLSSFTQHHKLNATLIKSQAASYLISYIFANVTFLISTEPFPEPSAPHSFLPPSLIITIPNLLTPMICIDQGIHCRKI